MASSFYRRASGGSGSSIQLNVVGVDSTDVDFPLAVKELQDLIDPKDIKKYAALGGLQGIAQKLRTDTKKGLSDEVDLVTENDVTTEVAFGMRKKRYAFLFPFFLLLDSLMTDSFSSSSFVVHGFSVLDDLLLLFFCCFCFILLHMGRMCCQRPSRPASSGWCTTRSRTGLSSS